MPLAILLGFTFAAALLAGVATAIALRPMRIARQAELIARAQRDFHRQREPLEAKFIEKAAVRGKPRGLRWVDVDFDDDVVYARDRVTKQLKALVAIEVTFEAVAGGGMEDVPNVAMAKAATAEFIHDGTRWMTEGKVYFNLAPSATVQFLAKSMELVEEQPAAGRA
ncbi:MAG: hypothetical protein ACKOSQ_12540 [Planctomycetaceae bacterium]